MIGLTYAEAYHPEIAPVPDFAVWIQYRAEPVSKITLIMAILLNVYLMADMYIPALTGFSMIPPFILIREKSEPKSQLLTSNNRP